MRMSYRHHSIEFKRALFEQSLLPGVSVSRLAREHDVNANQIFNWRKLYQAGGLVPMQRVALQPIQVREAQHPAHDGQVRPLPQDSDRSAGSEDPS